MIRVGDNMALFLYKAIDNRGKHTDGSIEAINSEVAVSLLRGRELYVVNIEEKRNDDIRVPFKGSNKVNSRDLAIMCRQLSTMLNAGINILNAIDVLKQQTTNKFLSSILSEIYGKVEKGNPVSFAMKDYPDVFPDILINMVEAGEVGGSIEKSFEKMAVYFEKEDKLKKKLHNALIYPVVVLVVSIVVLNILMIFVVPTFVGIFSEMEIELPAPTRFLLNMSTFLKEKWYIVFSVIFIAIWIYNIHKRTENGRKSVDKRKLSRPLTGKVALDAITARFSRTLSTLLNSGVPLISSLETTSKVLSNTYLEEKFKEVIDRVRGGEALSVPIENLNIFPTLVPLMIKTGEESGNLELMLNKIADFYEDEVDNSVTRLTAIFEPIVIIILAIMVGFLMASIVLPMFKLYGNVQ